MKVIDLFSGIGGFSLGLESTGGFETVQFVENNEWCQKVLAKNFPNVPITGDIKNYEPKRSERIGLVCGGFPCQPYSVAGKRKGTEDDRHLWPEMLRVIKSVKPKYIIGENVRNLTSIQDGMVFEQVCTDLENEGYEVQSFIIPASAVNAPHQRYRVWIVAHSDNNGQQGRFFETCDQAFARQRSKIIRRNGADMFSGSSNDGRNYAESTVNGAIQRSCNGNKTESTEPRSVCGVSEESNNDKNTLGENRHQENHDRALVQEGQVRVQPPINRGLGENKTTFERNKIRSRDDTDSRDRVETTTDVADSESNQEISELRTTESEHDKWNSWVESTSSSNRQSVGETKQDVANSYNTRNRTPKYEIKREGWWSSEPNVGRVAHGIPHRVDRLKGLGNAIVPQIAYQIGLAILEAEKTNA